MADLDESLRRILIKLSGAGLRGNDVDFVLAKHRMKRVLREDMFDVGDEQFLMLLLVMNPENDDRLDFIEKFFVRVGKEILDVRIDRRTISTRVRRWAARSIRAGRAGACRRRHCSKN